MNNNGNLRALQIFVYTRKFFRTQKRDSLISIAMAVVIFGLVLLITKDDMLLKFGSTKSGFFSIVSACIWIGIFNSIQLICREKNDIVKDELDKGLYASSYIAAHFIYQFFLCLVQTFITLILCVMMVSRFSGQGVMGSSFAEYFITMFLMIFASDALALIISAVVPTPIVAMTVMPLVLIIQLVLAGVIFELKGAAEFIAGITVSKWGMMAMGAVGNINHLETYLNPTTLMTEYYSDSAYNSTAGNLMLCWFILILFIAISFILSVAALKQTTKRLKK